MDNKFEINIDFLASYTSKKDLKANNFKNCKKLFNIFNLNGDKKLDKTEINNIFQQLIQHSEKNQSDSREEAYSIFDEIEAESFIQESKTESGQTLAQLGVTVKEVFNFLNTLLNEKTNSEEEQTEIYPEKNAEIDSPLQKDNSAEEGNSVEESVVLTEEQAQTAKELSNIPQRKKEQFTEKECAMLAQLTPDELEKAKNLFFIKSRKNQLSAEDIIYIVRDYKEKYNISEENYSRLSEILTLKDKKGNNIEANSIMSLLADRTSEELDKTLALLHSHNKEYDMNTIFDINYTIKTKSSYLYNLMLNNSNLKLSPQDKLQFLNADIRETSIDGKVYRFIIGQELPEEITREQAGDDMVETVHNPNLGIKQILTYPSAKLTDAVRFPSKIETQHFDKSGNLEYTEFYEDGVIPGTKNIYTIDKNGNRTNIQTGSVDSETGVQTITKNFVSTDGISTQFKLTANPNTNEYELNYEISNPESTEPPVIYSKYQSLKKTDENNFTYTKDGKTYNIKIEKENISENGIMYITDTSQNKTFEIDLNKLFQNEQDKAIAQRFVRMPAELLIFLSEHPLENMNYGIFKEGNGHFNKDNNTIELGTQTECKSDTELYDTVFSVLMHEFGHFVDYYIGETANSLSTNEDFIQCFKQELEEFKSKHTSEEQNAIGYFSGATAMEGFTRGCQETIAETNMLLNTISKESTSVRAYYLQRYFPKTIAFIANMMQERMNNN